VSAILTQSQKNFFKKIFRQKRSAAGDRDIKNIYLENKAMFMCWAADKIPTKGIAACLSVQPKHFRGIL
jgi:hypothetical protein